MSLNEDSLKNRKIPKIFWKAKWTDCDMTFDPPIPEGPESMYITGPNGVGKSHLAGALAMRWGAEWMATPRLMMELSKCMSKYAEQTQMGIYEYWSKRRVVVVDDLLAASKTEYGIMWLLAVISARIDDDRPTVVTCDRSLKDIDAIDSSLASRLAGFQQIRLTGRDRRMAK